MQRAAAALAAVCARTLGRVYGSRVAVLAGGGDNGGDALFAGARLARRGARVEAILASSRVHQAGLAALRAAGGRVVALGAPEPGDAPAALPEAAVRAVESADLIVDGVHVHPGVVDLALAAVGPRRLLLITDAMRAACMGDGEYELGGLIVRVEGGIARIDNGALAGSLLTLDEAFRRLVTVHGLDLAAASRMASLNPAALLGLDRSKGKIEAGMDADLVCLDHGCNVLWTMVGGRVVYRADA